MQQRLNASLRIGFYRLVEVGRPLDRQPKRITVCERQVNKRRKKKKGKKRYGRLEDAQSQMGNWKRKMIAGRFCEGTGWAG